MPNQGTVRVKARVTTVHRAGPVVKPCGQSGHPLQGPGSRGGAEERTPRRGLHFRAARVSGASSARQRRTGVGVGGTEYDPPLLEESVTPPFFPPSSACRDSVPSSRRRRCHPPLFSKCIHRHNVCCRSMYAADLQHTLCRTVFLEAAALSYTVPYRIHAHIVPHRCDGRATSEQADEAPGDPSHRHRQNQARL